MPTMSQHFSLTTRQLAQAAGVAPHAIHAHLKRHGHWKGHKPRKQPNGHHLWPREALTGHVNLSHAEATALAALEAVTGPLGPQFPEVTAGLLGLVNSVPHAARHDVDRLLAQVAVASRVIAAMDRAELTSRVDHGDRITHLSPAAQTAIADALGAMLERVQSMRASLLNAARKV